jgi:type IV pilus assembly protein PilC
MPIFTYTARNEFGEKVQGKVEAQSQSQAAAALRNRNLLVVEVKAASDSTFSAITTALSGVKLQDLVNFTRQLSTMIGAGLPLATSLAILQGQSKPAMSQVVTKLLKDVESGESFAKALQEHPKVFSRVYVQLVKAGELGGVMDEVLLRLADNLEKEKEFKAKTKGAMIYPIIVIISMVVVAIIMMVFVIPQLTEMYQDFNAKLPLPTRVLIGTSQFMRRFWFILLGLVVAAVVGIRQWGQTETGERKLDELVMKIPIVGTLHKKMVLTEFCRTLSLLLSAGVSVLEALDIVAESLKSVILREAVAAAKEDVEQGVPLSQALGVYEVMPMIVPQMVSVGEETGKIDEILFKLSDYYEREAEYAVKNLTTAMEPVIMVLLGVGVGFMVISIIMPIYNLTGQF